MPSNNQSTNYSDLPDSPKDREKLKPETTTMDLPDVSDIPGQEHVHVAPLGELADTTASSADEEGERIFNEALPGGESELDNTDEGDVTNEEKELLRRADEDMPTNDDQQLRNATLDSTDMDGEPLNEAADVAGDDLDVPGAEDDDENENIGEEDEENNPYSLGGDNHED